MLDVLQEAWGDWKLYVQSHMLRLRKANIAPYLPMWASGEDPDD